MTTFGSTRERDSDRFRIALCQFAAGEDKERNLEQILKMMEQAAAQSTDAAVFPEYAMAHFRGESPDFLGTAESIDGPFVERIRESAKRLQTAVVFGMTEAIPGESLAYNTVLAVDRQGRIAATYRKAHLYDAFGNRESDRVKPGPLEDPVVVDLDGVRLGILTCYDLRFPEPARTHADAGVDVLIYPAAWAPGDRKEDQWRILVRARALENTLFVAAVGQTPDEGVGHSMAVGPSGEVLAELGTEPGTQVVDLETNLIPAVRRRNPSLANRRYAVAPLQATPQDG